MTDIPFKSLTVLSAVFSVAVVNYLPPILVIPQVNYLESFVLAWILQFMIWVIWKVFLYPKVFSPLRHLPSPAGGSWWNGHFPEISAQPTGTPMVDWVNSVPNDGIIRYLGILNTERLLITSPKTLKEVLTARTYDFIKPAHVATGIGRLLGIGVLLAEGDEHKKQRRNLMPAFAFRHVKGLYPVFWEKSRQAVDEMSSEIQVGGTVYEDLPDYQKASKTKSKDAVIEAGEWASRATLDIIGVASMGHDFNAIRDPESPLNRTYRIVFKPSRQAQILGILNLFLPGWFVRRLPMERNGEIEEAAAVVRNTCRQLIRSKKEKLEKKKLVDLDILSVALESGGFSEENLIDQMMTFLAAGHETTATALTWAVYMLCLNPDVQSRLRAEIRANLPSISFSETIASTQIDNLTYLNAVCNEVLRYYPPVPLTLREAVRDTFIGDQAIPKGTRIMIVPWAINKAEELWGSDARKFRPERWIPNEDNPYAANGGAVSNYSYLTFLHGPRSCIGQAFAKAEFACLLAAWIGRFEFELNDQREMEEKNILIKGGVTAKPARGLHVKVRVIDGW